MLTGIALLAASVISGVTVDDFGSVNGRTAQLYTLTNSNGAVVKITNFGATITSVIVPDKAGNFEDVVLGFDSVEGYASKGNPYFGCTVGRYANRIAKGSFSLEGKKYTLAINNKPNSLHGGPEGFHRRFWKAVPFSKNGNAGVRMSYTSKHMEEGFPGTLTVGVSFTLTQDNSVQIDYTATTDKTTVVNLTNHSYFNLNGAGSGPVLDHLMFINADRFTPIDATSIPLAKMRSVGGTPFEFRKPIAIGDRINADYDQIKNGSGYDHNFILNKGKKGGLTLAAITVSQKTGRVLRTLTTEPGVQLYTGNFLDGTVKGKGGVTYGHRTGFCLEAQRFPDSPNRPDFPSATLKPGQTYRQTTVYKFGIEGK